MEKGVSSKETWRPPAAFQFGVQLPTRPLLLWEHSPTLHQLPPGCPRGLSAAWLHWSASRSQLPHMCFSSAFDAFLAFRLWRIIKRLNPDETCLSLQFAQVEMLFLCVCGIRVNYDPNWSRLGSILSRAHTAHQLCLLSPGLVLASEASLPPGRFTETWPGSLSALNRAHTWASTSASSCRWRMMMGNPANLGLWGGEWSLTPHQVAVWSVRHGPQSLD